MKKTYLFLIQALLILGLALTAGGCSKDDNSSGSLVGTWLLVEVNGIADDYDTVLTFTEDGRLLQDGEGLDTYTFRDNVIYFTYVPANEIIWGDRWKVVSLNSKNLVADAIYDKKPSNNARVKFEKIDNDY